jgi:CRISPR-associated endonuclease/helicase Cas3
MGTNNFKDWFEEIMGFAPYGYQERYATEKELPQLLSIPTGAGKTATILMGWLWRRLFADETVRENTPRRLIYCLPMRILVEQTIDIAKQLCHKIEEKGQNSVSVHTLMGGDLDRDIFLYPEKNSILIGTQDMLLSRALNRGYAASRYRWPMEFGVLNNDCQWVFDEVQLMDVGVATSTQLAGFRQKLGTFLPVPCTWMSATIDKDWLNTVDFSIDSLSEPLCLTDRDVNSNKSLSTRYNALKPLEKSTANMGQFELIADVILAAHQPSTRTLAIFNTVNRAREVYKQLQKNKTKAQLVLLHSRFRQQDREQKVKQLLEEPSEQGTIIISTQVVEAGVDVSAKTMFTELAPWASLVQRLGRCNRKGEWQDAKVVWFDLDSKEKSKQFQPYSEEELLKSQDLLNDISDVSPASLTEVNAKLLLEYTHVIRRRDLVDLFDTTADLTGNDIDISRYIRSGDEHDVHVFWREIPQKTAHSDPLKEIGEPHRNELCPVPVYEFREFVKKPGKGHVWKWDHLGDQWVTANGDQDIYPGQVFLVRSAAGGYGSEVGWDKTHKDTVPECTVSVKKQEAYENDTPSIADWKTIAQHTDDVVEELLTILKTLSLQDDISDALLLAARWHDRGKAHPIFQSAIMDGETQESEETIPTRPLEWAGKRDIAKAPNSPTNFWKRYQRKHFRHELASGLAMLQQNHPDLAAYLVAAHHGKVRLSIRSMPEETKPDDSSRLFARGIWDEDELPETPLGDTVLAPAVTLSLQCMQLGRAPDGSPSWAERMLRLRDDPELGPFRLAYLENLLRAADIRASKKENSQSKDDQEEFS